MCVVGPHTQGEVLNFTLYKINISRFASNLCGFGVKMRKGSKSASKKGKIMCVWLGGMGERGGGGEHEKKNC